MKRLDQIEFERKLKEQNIFYNDYFYITGKFINCRTKIEVSTPYGVCLTNPYSLLDGNKPTIQTAVNKNMFFTKKAKKIHGDRYDYSKVNYINNITPVCIICSKHGEFYQKPNAHLNGNGCPICNPGGWDGCLSYWLNTKNDIAIFYVLRCYSNDEDFIKIGITTTTIKERYRKKDAMPYNFDIIYEKKSTNKKYIWDMERKYMNKLKYYSYTPKINFGGKTECFKIEILDNFKISQ